MLNFGAFILPQVAVPFLIAGVGTIGAGLLLGYVEVSCCGLGQAVRTPRALC